MSRLIVLAQPRSCSTFFMRQLIYSPLLSLCRNYHHELVNPLVRNTTSEYLGINPPSNLDEWEHDIRYAIEYFRQFPNGAYKSLVHAHGVEYRDFLLRLPDTTFVCLRREDEASLIASIIAKTVLFKTEPSTWASPARAKPIKFRGSSEKITGHMSDCRYLDVLYWSLVHKSKVFMDAFQNAYTITCEQFHQDYHHDELEREYEMKFDFNSFRPPSHYSEIFTDWKHYEKTVRQVLGNIPGLG